MRGLFILIGKFPNILRITKTRLAVDNDNRRARKSKKILGKLRSLTHGHQYKLSKLTSAAPFGLLSPELTDTLAS